MSQDMIKKCHSYEKCPFCQGFLLKGKNSCQCQNCGFFLDDKCCHGQEQAIIESMEKAQLNE